MSKEAHSQKILRRRNGAAKKGDEQIIDTISWPLEAKMRNRWCNPLNSYSCLITVIFWSPWNCETKMPHLKASYVVWFTTVFLLSDDSEKSVYTEILGNAKFCTLYVKKFYRAMGKIQSPFWKKSKAVYVLLLLKLIKRQTQSLFFRPVADKTGCTAKLGSCFREPSSAYHPHLVWSIHTFMELTHSIIFAVDTLMVCFFCDDRLNLNLQFIKIKSDCNFEKAPQLWVIGKLS